MAFTPKNSLQVRNRNAPIGTGLFDSDELEVSLSEKPKSVSSSPYFLSQSSFKSPTFADQKAGSVKKSGRPVSSKPTLSYDKEGKKPRSSFCGAVSVAVRQPASFPKPLELVPVHPSTTRAGKNDGFFGVDYVQRKANFNSQRLSPKAPAVKQLSDHADKNSDSCPPSMTSRSTTDYPPPKKLRFSTGNMENQGMFSFAKMEGLKNLGNTCYMNAALQALLRIPSFSDSLLCPKWLAKTNVTRILELLDETEGASLLDYDENKENNTTSAMLYSSLAQMVHLLRNTERHRVVNPANLKKAFERHTGDRFTGAMEQHDAHEYMIEMMNALETELRHFQKENSSKHLAKMRLLELPTAKNFEMEVEVDLKCYNCNYVRSKCETYTNLSLDLPAHGQPQTLNELLETFFSQKDLYLVCEKCSSKLVTAQHSIKRIPRVLLVHLKRFEFSREKSTFLKLANPVQVPYELALDQFCLSSVEGITQAELASCASCGSEHSPWPAKTRKDPKNSPQDRLNARVLEVKNSKEKEEAEREQPYQPIDRWGEDFVGKVSSEPDKNFASPVKTVNEEEENLEKAIRASLEDQELMQYSPELFEDEPLQEWHCAVCTYINKESTSACCMCAEPKPEGLPPSAPPEASPENRETMPAPQDSSHLETLPTKQEVAEKKFVYELKSIVHHFGGISSGHYVASVAGENGSKKWKIYDDSVVRAVDNERMSQISNKGSAYICCFKLANGT